MNKNKLMWSGLLLCAVHSSGALALTLWDNGGPGGTSQGSSNLSDTQQAQDFKLTFTSDLTAVRFWNLESTAADYVGSIFTRSPATTRVYPARSWARALPPPRALQRARCWATTRSRTTLR